MKATVRHEKLTVRAEDLEVGDRVVITTFGAHSLRETIHVVKKIGFYDEDNIVITWDVPWFSQTNGRWPRRKTRLLNPTYHEPGREFTVDRIVRDPA